MKRKSLFFLLFLALGLPWAANAQETLTVCDGTTTNGKIPVNGLYVDTQGTTSEFIIPATTEGMSDMEGGTVSKLTFYVPNPPATWGSPTIQLYIGEVEYTTLSTLNGPTNFTVVAAGVWDNTQTTIEVEFVTPYTYEGGNLLIGTYVQTKSSTYKTTNFAGVSAESGSSMYNDGSGSGTAQSFLPKTTFTYTPGGGSICEKPATMETSNVTSNSAILTWTGGSGTYNLEYKLASAEDWTSLLTNTTATTYTLQDLNPDKAYQARVQSVCGEDVSGWKSVNFRTSFAIPLIEEFGTSIPTGWAMYTGLLENVMAGTAELTSTTYGWNFGEGNDVFDNHAYVNIYGSNCQKWLVMPTVTIEDSIQLQFDMALTAYNSNMPEPSLTGIDDKFIVLINVGSNWTILRQWDNAGSEYVYNDIASPATGQTVSIDLSSYAGQQVAVAFYGESTESNADNNLHIDNVNITRVNATDLYIVTVSANPANGGMVSGGGEFAYGQTCTITATSTEGYSFVNWTENGEIVSTDATYSFTVNANRTLVANFIYDGGGSGDHTYVDLGMPSGLLWATCNVGAETPEDYGDYFAWGETQPKDYYDWSIYQYCMGSNTTLTKYCSNSSYGYNGFTDNLTILLPEDDAATANWGNDWRMPTKEEFEELYNNTTVSWTTQNGVEGRLFVAANGNTLFLPATGYRWNGELYYAGSRGNYWSSSLYTVTSVPDIACQLYFTVNSNCQIVSDSRDGGQPVRPVRSSQNTSFIIDATANPTEGGTVTGSGTYLEGSLCTVTATPAEGYYFMNWTQGGTVVSSTATYSFVVEANVDLVANFAEGIYIGDGGTATSQYLPSYSYYKYSLTQQIYTAEEIGTSGMITSIAFFNGGAEKTRTYDFYMKHTTKSNFSNNTDWIAVSPSDMVFSGSVTMVADGWTTITFDTPFVYDGTSNVVFVADDNSDEWTSSPHMSCRVFDVDDTQAIYKYADGTNYNPYNPSEYSGTRLSEKNQIILGMGSASDFYVISATANPTEGGNVTGGGTYNNGSVCTLMATPNDGYTFMNWTKDNVEVSTEATYSFTVTENATYVANFILNQGEVTQENTLAQGYNWWSTYIEQEGVNGLEMLENSLGGNGVAIRSQASGYTDYYGEDYGWWGSLTSINNESSYRVVASTPCTVTMTGTEAVPSQHPITLNHGWTWMGYVPSTAMDVNTAMAGMEASDGDMLKSQQGYADYYPNYGWYGSLNTIEPGMGLMYYSASGETVTFTYPDSNRGGELKANITAEHNHWKPNTFAYPDNMTVMATIELDGEELNSEHYELAAFANGECRGSVRLTYAEPLHRHVAFLTISGKDAAELSFRLYDTETGVEYYDAEESLSFVANAIVGTADDLYTIHFRGTTGMDEFASRVQVYPNPVNVGERFSINVADDVKNPVRVEIVNALGVETMRATSVQTPIQLTAPATAGVYTLRIITEDKGAVVRKLIVK